jgi:oligosaccharide repeat unit polymerase
MASIRSIDPEIMGSAISIGPSVRRPVGKAEDGSCGRSQQEYVLGVKRVVGKATRCRAHNAARFLMQRFAFHTHRFTGQRALLLSWSIWLVCLIVMPVRPMFYGTMDSVLLLVCANVALWAGLSVSSLWGATSTEDQAGGRSFESRHIHLIMLLLVAAGGTSIIVRTIDYVFVRGVDFTQDVERIRMQLEQAGPNFLSVVYTMTFPAAVAGGIVALPLLWNDKRQLLPWLAMIFFGASPIFSILLSGRSILFVIVGSALIALVLVAPRVTAKLIKAVAATLLLFLAAAVGLFSVRMIERGYAFDMLAQVSTFTLLVPLDDNVLIGLRDLSDFPKLALYNIAAIGQYMLHGVFEFFALVQLKSPDDPWLLGRYQLAVFDNIQKLFVPRDQIVDLESYNPTTSVFSTFWGPAYIDFGYLMMIYGFVFGLIVDRVRKLVDQGDLFALPLYALFLLQIFLVPVGSLLAATSHVNLAFFGIWMLSRLLAKWRFGQDNAAVLRAPALGSESAE